jgi:hypothetical protein
MCGCISRLVQKGFLQPAFAVLPKRSQRPQCVSADIMGPKASAGNGFEAPAEGTAARGGIAGITKLTAMRTDQAKARPERNSLH